jgi:predicted nuclease of predicted toxin-antitoxin system
VRFLADESCDFTVVRALLAAGHDVVAVAQVRPGASDDLVIDLALQDARILLTEDRDFGQLVYASGQTSAGVIYMRFPAAARTLQARTVLELVERVGPRLDDAFVVVQPGRARINRRP